MTKVSRSGGLTQLMLALTLVIARGKSREKGKMLSKSQVEQYRQDGYVVAEAVLDEGELGTLRGKRQDLLEGARGLTGHTDIYDLEPFHKPDEPRVRRIKTPHKFFPIFREFV